VKNALDIEKFDESLNEDELIKAIEGKRPGLPPLTALKHFVKRVSPLKKEVCKRLIEDSSQASEIRKMAALEMGREYAPENQKILIRGLRSSDERLLGAAAYSLGRIGDEKALAHLEELQVRPDSPALKDIVFAKHLIAYRNQLNKHLFVPPKAEDLLRVDEENAIEFSAETVGADRLKGIYDQVKHSLPATPISEKNVLRITCRSTEFLLAFTEKFQSKRGIASLRKTSALSKVILKKGYCPDRYFLAYYMFSHPSEKKDELVLIGTRPSGVISFSGKVKMSEDRCSFKIQSVKSRYTAALNMEAEYHFRKRKYTVKKAVSQMTLDTEQSPAGTPASVNIDVR